MAINEYVHMPTLEEYSERFKVFFHFKIEDNIIDAKLYANKVPVH